MTIKSAHVRLRMEKFKILAVPWPELSVELVNSAEPWRQVRHYHGQLHFPGWFWSERIGRRLMYESRLELARLLVADADPHLLDVREQVFFLTLNFSDGSVIRHIPDFFICTENQRPRLVNVKPSGWEKEEKFRKTFDALNSLCAEQGWSYETWTGEKRSYLENLRWLSGYRRRSVIPATDEEIRSTLELVTDPMAIQVLERQARDIGVDQPRTVVMHMLWNSTIQANLALNLSARSEVWR